MILKETIDSLANRIMLMMVDGQTVQFGPFRNDTPTPRFKCDLPPMFIALLMLVNPAYWIAEAYCRGHWGLREGDLSDFLTHTQERAPIKFKKYVALTQTKFSPLHLLKQKILSRHFTRHVKKNYDLFPDIYASFLDDEMVYTCAFYEGEDTLETAQNKKFQTIVDRVELPNACAKILNIGCGWGSFERFIVRNSSAVHVTGLSISSVQVAWAEERNRQVFQEEENSRIHLRIEDYVDHTVSEKYDAITAIGMVEHVGQSGYREFFEKCETLLKPRGILLIHMIIKADSDVPTNRWIDKYIFPGGYAPSISELTWGAERRNFRVKNIHIHHPDNYAKTLAAWRHNLYRNKDAILSLYHEKLGYSLQTATYLFRQWEIYLAGSEASFRVMDGPLQVAHFVFEKYTDA